MRKRLLLFSLIFSVLIVVGLKTVSASTDCDRWLQQYKEQLANAAPVKHAQRRIRHLLHRTQPRPQLIHVSSPIHHYVVKPKLSPRDMLRRFHVLCGDLPPDGNAFTPAQLVAPPFSAPPAILLTANEAPPVAFGPPNAALTPAETASTTPVESPGVPVTPFPIVPVSPSGSPVLPRSPGVPGSPSSPGSPGTTAIPPVPEPSSIVLLLTGVVAMLGLGARQRLSLAKRS
jgi:hypothetical protein